MRCTLRNQVRSEDGLANARRADKHADVVREYGPCRPLLRFRQVTIEFDLELERLNRTLRRLAAACQAREPTGDCPILEALEE